MKNKRFLLTAICSLLVSFSFAQHPMILGFTPQTWEDSAEINVFTADVPSYPIYFSWYIRYFGTFSIPLQLQDSVKLNSDNDKFMIRNLEPGTAYDLYLQLHADSSAEYQSNFITQTPTGVEDATPTDLRCFVIGNTLHIESSNIGSANISIFNLLGQKEIELVEVKNKMEIDISSLSLGEHILWIGDNKRQKFIR